MSKFEEDLQTYFPDIFRLHQLGKFDKKLWTAIYRMLEFYDDNGYGDVTITYQSGKINHIAKTVKE
jgi:hypothetical protein